MITSKIKFFAGLAIITLILIAFVAFCQTIYKTGKAKAEIECKEKEVEVQTQTVEVVKYIYKDTSAILLKPNKTFSELLERMKRNEI